MVELFNWTSYRGSHIFNFYTSNNRNGYAIFGENSRGKTSFTDAIQWAMYGEAWTKAIIDSDRRERKKRRPLVSVDETDDPLLNLHAFRNNEYEMMVKIIFDHDGDRWTLARTASANRKTPTSDKDMGTYLRLERKESDTILEKAEAQDFIDTLLPKNIRRFFFIDGESVNEYRALIASTEENLEIRKNIEDILNFPILKRGISDLNDVKQRYVTDLSRIASDTKKNRRLIVRIEEYEAAIDGIKRMMKKATSERDKAEEVITDLENKLSSFASSEALIERRKGIIRQLESKESELENLYVQRKEENQNLWLSLIQTRLLEVIEKIEPQLQEYSETQHRISTLSNKISHLSGILEGDKTPCPTCGSLPHLRDEKERESDLESITAMTEESKILQESMDSQKSDIKRYNSLQKFRTTSRLKISERQEAKIGELMGSIDRLKEDKDEVDDMLKDIKQELISEMNASLKTAREGRASQVSRLRRHQNEIDDIVANKSKLARNLIGSDGSKESLIASRKIEALAWLEELWTTVLDNYTQQVRTVIEERATQTFRELTNNPDGYSALALNNGFGLTILDSNKKPVPAPSPGVQQIAAVSLIDALGRTSDIEFPILFDTPGASIDQEHRDNIIRYFWSKRDIQLIILAHSGEFRPDEVEEKHDGLLARTWELIFDGELNTTKVVPRVV